MYTTSKEKNILYNKTRSKYLGKIDEKAFNYLFEEYSGDPKRYQGNKRARFKEYRTRFFTGQFKAGVMFNELERLGKKPIITVKE